MRLKSRFRQVGQASGTADEVWRCEALGVRLDWYHLVQQRFEVAQHTDAVGQSAVSRLR
jgi:hypothetical protein